MLVDYIHFNLLKTSLGLLYPNQRFNPLTLLGAAITNMEKIVI